MKPTDKQLLRQLGAGESIASVCVLAGISRSQFDEWWRQQIESRVPAANGTVRLAVKSEVTIERDQLGIPHIYAANDSDVYFGFGYAMAADRLFQLDYLRRKGLGRLAEILGPEAKHHDLIARAVGLHRIAANEWEQLRPDVQELLNAFTSGVNAYIQQTSESLPIEFDLLDYHPEPWTPIDCLAIESEFRWYLTGRLPAIAMPELARRRLGDGPLYAEYLLGEADEASILHPGEYPSTCDKQDHEPVGNLMADPQEGIGSNNWVISGRRTETGLPLVGSDPHIAFEAVSCWYPAHLCGGSFDVAGTAYVGIPAIMIGRNQRVAWGITNNICMQRDLYQEQTDEQFPDCFLFDGEWVPQKVRTERIPVQGSDPFEVKVVSSHNGPIVNDLLPDEIKQTDPVSLKWLGAYQGGWLTAMLDMGRANSSAEFREALRPWHVPTFSLVFADVDGHTGYQSTGRIPVRDTIHRGFRPGWDPQHQWRGLIPFEHMPRLDDPDRGWIATANNRVAADDYPHLLHGCWVSGWRAERIEQMILSEPQLTLASMQSMQSDVKSLRAQQLVPSLLKHMDRHADASVRAAGELLRHWDFHSTADSAATAVFNTFFTCWSHEVARERFEPAEVELMSKGVEWCAGRLLVADPAGWFSDGDREVRIANALSESIALLERRFGPDMSQWKWGDLHRMPRPHVLSQRGDLKHLLDPPDAPVAGDMVSVGNTGCGPDWTATTGGGYRMVCDLSSQPPTLHAIDAQSQSGHVGSPHYDDQFESWRNAAYHEIPLDRTVSSRSASSRQVLKPLDDSE